MQTNLSDEFLNTPLGDQAQAILRKCVHCGFCTATCPTYQIFGDELDGPRGRIYLIKQVLEGAEATRATQTHLDRCLTCRNCESTCPSGVDYGHLVDIGREVVEAKVKRPIAERALREALKWGLTSPLFGPAMRLGQWVRPLLPPALKAKVPERRPAGREPTRSHARKVLMLAGCVQPSMAPNINAATKRVLDAAGIEVLVAREAGCCGAVKYHLADSHGAKIQIKANIDAWWPHIESGVEAIVMNASGCGVMVKDYGHIMASDAEYAERAARVSALTKDLSELLPAMVSDLLPSLDSERVAQVGALAYHPPCTLQHGQKRRDEVLVGLRELGFAVDVASQEAHLCCGSAGTYSVLQSDTAEALRDRKLGHLMAALPSVIVSANIGCITHLQSGSEVPVRHWVEVLDSALAPQDTLA
jgi:glycolate oxidase iron-sulfur subunit